MIKYIKENVLGILAGTLLLNGMAIVYMIRYTTQALIKLALAIGLADSIFSLILFVVIGVDFTKRLFFDNDES